jgi:hypothetical protein
LDQLHLVDQLHQLQMQNQKHLLDQLDQLHHEDQLHRVVLEQQEAVMGQFLGTLDCSD